MSRSIFDIQIIVPIITYTEHRQVYVISSSVCHLRSCPATLHPAPVWCSSHNIFQAQHDNSHTGSYILSCTTQLCCCVCGWTTLLSRRNEKSRIATEVLSGLCLSTASSRTMRRMASAAAAAAAFASHTCCTTTTAMPASTIRMTAAFMNTTPPTSLSAQKMTLLTRRSFVSRLGLSPLNSSSSSRICGAFSHDTWTTCSGGFSRHQYHDHDDDTIATHRHRTSCPPTALYCTQGQYFPRTWHSKPLLPLTNRSWSSGSSSSGQQRRASTRLMGLRKPRGTDGPPSHGKGPEEREGDRGGEGSKEAKAAPARSPWGRDLQGSSIPASKRQPPEEDDIWSKHSVFEFKRCVCLCVLCLWARVATCLFNRHDTPLCCSSFICYSY